MTQTRPLPVLGICLSVADTVKRSRLILILNVESNVHRSLMAMLKTEASMLLTRDNRSPIHD